MRKEGWRKGGRCKDGRHIDTNNGRRRRQKGNAQEEEEEKSENGKKRGYKT